MSTATIYLSTRLHVEDPEPTHMFITNREVTLNVKGTDLLPRALTRVYESDKTGHTAIYECRRMMRIGHTGSNSVTQRTLWDGAMEVWDFDAVLHPAPAHTGGADYLHIDEEPLVQYPVDSYHGACDSDGMSVAFMLIAERALSSSQAQDDLLEYAQRCLKKGEIEYGTPLLTEWPSGPQALREEIGDACNYSFTLPGPEGTVAGHQIREHLAEIWGILESVQVGG